LQLRIRPGAPRIDGRPPRLRLAPRAHFTRGRDIRAVGYAFEQLRPRRRTPYLEQVLPQAHDRLRPANDAFSDAAELTGTHGHIDGTTFFASVENGESNYVDYRNIVSSVWYRFRPKSSGVLSLESGDTSFAIDWQFVHE
jgi:hypothetical protein